MLFVGNLKLTRAVPWTQCSIQASHVCNFSWAVYEGVDDGTVYTDK